MIWDDPVVLAYEAIYIAALAIAVWRRKAFPLGSVIPILLIIGFGFTGLVYLFVPQHPIQEPPAIPNPSEMIFVLGYLGFMAALLARRRFIPDDPDHFVEKKQRDMGFKLLFFVLIPLAGLKLIWGAAWSELGFSMGDFSSQLISAAILIVLLGGFNLIAGGAAAPIRARQFNARQLFFGFGLAFIWSCIEAGFVEEFFFRAFLQTRLVNFLQSPAGGICTASLLFGLAHAPGIYLRRGGKHGPLGEQPSLLDSVLYSILVLSPTGWFTGLLYWRTQSLIAPILVHGGLDAVAATADFINGLPFLTRAGQGGTAVQ
jgi:membrane protease YdiL (CAAX protease family)